VKRESDLKRRLRSLQTLGEAVGAMKSLSAHHFRETRSAVEPARVYREGVERFLGWAGAGLTPGDGPAGLLVVGGELGLCGGYNAHLVGAGAERRSALGPGPTICVGHRAGALLARRDVKVSRLYAAPTSVRGITDLLLRLAEDVLQTYVAERLASFDIVSSRFGGVGIDRPTSVRLLPLESKRSQPAPTVRYVSTEHLASAAVREYLYIVLYDLLLDALASEHSARLVATQAAERWLEERTNTVRLHLAATRREASTQEVIEIAGGARARARSSGPAEGTR
jgi:F-type H+-transporting ATPase subunit gamma